MTVFRRSAVYHYDFWFKGRRYTGSTDQTTKEQAARVEAKIKEQLRLDRWGLAPIDRLQTPSFTAWAEQYLQTQQRRIRRPDIVQRTLRMVLAFFGTRPTHSTPIRDGTYHDLRLLDPIVDPQWIVKFEAWMDARGLAGSTKNSYRSVLSGLYKLAAKPEWRAKTKTQERNPFQNIHRDRQVRRQVYLSSAQLRSWLTHAEPHARLAIAIGSLAPKLRLQQVLDLRFDHHTNADLTTIRYREHKTLAATGEDQVTPISANLKAILEAAKRGRKRPTFVITYRGERVKSIKRALKSAAKDAGLVYGMKAGGVTFHALRHAMATEIARLGTVARVLHASTMGHKDPRTTEQFYTHLDLDDQRQVLEQLADRLAIQDLLISADGTFVGTGIRMRGKDRKKRRRRRSADPGINGGTAAGTS